MICRKCGIEIADKALICFRCGTATSEPVHQPAEPAPSQGLRWMVVLALAAGFLVASAFFVTNSGSGEPISPMTWAMLAAAGVLLALRLRRR